MKQNIFIGIFLFASCFSAFALPAGAPTQKVTVRADLWCPHNCDPSSDKPGYMIEITRNALKEHGIELDYQLLNWARAIQETREGKFDAIIGAVTSDAPDFTFPKSSEGSTISCFYKKKDNPWIYKDVSDLSHLKSIGAINDYSYGTQVDNWVKANLAKMDYVSGDNPLQMNVDKVLNNRISVFIDDQSVVSYFLSTKVIKNDIVNAGCSKIDPLYIAFSPNKSLSKRSQELANYVTSYINTIKKNGKLQDILSRYDLKVKDIFPKNIKN